MTARITGTTYVLAVPDVTATARWWIDRLGFESWLDVEGWAFLRRDACYLRIGECPDAIPPRDLGEHQFFAYVELDDVDAFFYEITSRGVEPLFAPKDQPWGMREMGVATPDGHRIMFATDIE